MKIFLTLIFLLILETVIIFMLIQKNRWNNMNKDVPGYKPKIPLTVAINISSSSLKLYKENVSVKNTSVDTT